MVEEGPATRMVPTEPSEQFVDADDWDEAGRAADATLAALRTEINDASIPANIADPVAEAASPARDQHSLRSRIGHLGIRAGMAFGRVVTGTAERWVPRGVLESRDAHDRRVTQESDHWDRLDRHALHTAVQIFPKDTGDETRQVFALPPGDANAEPEGIKRVRRPRKSRAKRPAEQPTLVVEEPTIADQNIS